MKKTNQDKKKTDTNKGVKLPLIKNNTQKGNLKENKENNSKGKNSSKQEQKKNVSQIPEMPNIPLTKNIPKNSKSFENTALSQNSNKSKGKSESKKRKQKFSIKEDSNTQTGIIQDGLPRFTKERLSQLKEQRKQRIKQEKKEELKEIQVYEKLIEEYKSGKAKKIIKNNKNEINEDNAKIIISSKKAQNILEEGGMLDAYKYLLAQLCKNGLPSGNVFEYASIVVKNYEKKWKEKKSQMMKDKIDKYYEEKEKEINQNNENEGETKLVNKSLEHRNELKFIKNLDKSRSGRNIVPLPNNNPAKKDRFSHKLGKGYIIFFNKNINQENEFRSMNKENEEENNNPRKMKENSAEQNNQIIKNKNLNSDNYKSRDLELGLSANKRNYI